MSARLCRLEIVQSDAGWFWRFIASNGKELARSSETYKRRRDCHRCAYVVLGCFPGDPDPDSGDDSVMWRDSSHREAEVRVLDERTEASGGQS